MRDIPKGCPGFLAGGAPGSPHIVPGSVEHACFFCDAPTLISPDGEQFKVSKPGLLVVCTDCAVKMAEDGMETNLTPGFAAQLRADYVRSHRN